MRSKALYVDLADGVVTATGPMHPEPRPVPGAVAKSWGSCTIPGCDHGPCPAKLRAWANYGKRYICADADCDHHDCPPRQRADEDCQPFGLPYDGPALPQHVVDMDGVPLGAPMVAVQDEVGAWRLWPVDRHHTGSGVRP